MIKFFRNIRKESITKHKFSKYLIYAFGEIVLVVIGILIALQINNSNEDKKSDAIRKNYYNQILQDLSKDYKYINAEIKRLETNIVLYDNYLKNFSKQENVEALLLSQLKLNYIYLYLEFNTNTIETLQSTGDIKLIPAEIRNKLINLKNLQDNLIVTTAGNNDNFVEALLSATNLGFSPNVLRLKFNNQSDKLFDELNAASNFSKIALILNSAYNLKNLTETDLLNSSKNMLLDIDTLFNLINKELGNPYKYIELVTEKTLKLEKLINEGKTVDEVVVFVKQQDKDTSIYDISEAYINRLGYIYMNANKNEEALKIFKLNIELYPKAWNTYDSYGECLLKMGETEKAVEAYKKSLELNPKNETAKKVISDYKNSL